MHKLFINQISEKEKMPPDIKISLIGQLPISKSKDKTIKFHDKEYELLKKLPDNYKVVGYIHADKKEKKNIKWNGNKSLLSYNQTVLSNLYEKPQIRTIGYLKSNKEDEYFQVTRPFFFIPIWFFPVLLATLIALFMVVFRFPSTLDKPTFGNDIVTDGSITENRVEPLDPVYFNVKINATPILEKGKMNIRIENSKRNIYSCHVKVTADVNDEQVTIYNSPLIHPDKSIEYATVSNNITSGIYDGKAFFTYFDGKEQLSENTTVRLILNVR